MPKIGEEIAIMKTNMGVIKFRLFPQDAPKTVENFTGLAETNYYDGIIFHRVINDFMIQGGDPTATGRGGASLWDEPFEDEFSDRLIHIKGALSMANSGPNTNGSQFFIVQNDNGTPHLNYRHSVFGQVFEGLDVVDRIAAVETDQNDKPLEDVVIESLDIVKFEE